MEYLNKNFVKKYSSPTAISYSKDDVNVQMIIIPEMMGLTPKELVEEFDFTICMGAYDFSTREFYLHDRFIYDLSRRSLNFNVLAKYPLASLFRVKKYTSKGYRISGTEIIKLGLAINKLEMRSYVDLRKQLHGIDTLFLMELTDKLLSSEYGEKDYDFQEFINLLEDYDIQYLDSIMEH